MSAHRLSIWLSLHIPKRISEDHLRSIFGGAISLAVNIDIKSISGKNSLSLFHKQKM